jgi:membrane protein YqaA with SNARE-associated domain
MIDPHELVTELGLYAGSFATGVVSSWVPFVLVDVFLIAATSRVGASPGLVALILLAAIGQLVGKLPMYFAVRGGAALAEKHSRRVERLRRWLERFRNRPHVVLAASALTGLPPFSIVASAAGLLGVRLRAFCTIVLGGRALRFTAVVAATLLAR